MVVNNFWKKNNVLVIFLMAFAAAGRRKWQAGSMFAIMKKGPAISFPVGSWHWDGKYSGSEAISFQARYDQRKRWQ